MKRPKPAPRKTLKIRKDLIERVRRVLGTQGDKQTVEAALDMVLFKWEVTEGLRALRELNTTDDDCDDGFLSPGIESSEHGDEELQVLASDDVQRELGSGAMKALIGDDGAVTRIGEQVVDRAGPG